MGAYFSKLKTIIKTSRLNFKFNKFISVFNPSCRNKSREISIPLSAVEMIGKWVLTKAISKSFSRLIIYENLIVNKFICTYIMFKPI